jgi:hypothetical protein
VAWTSPFKRTLQALVRRGLFLFNSHPRFRQGGLAILHRLGLYGVVRTYYHRLTAAAARPRTGSQDDTLATDTARLTPHTRRIYAGLAAAAKRSRTVNS